MCFRDNRQLEEKGGQKENEVERNYDNVIIIGPLSKDCKE